MKSIKEVNELPLHSQACIENHVFTDTPDCSSNQINAIAVETTNAMAMQRDENDVEHATSFVKQQIKRLNACNLGQPSNCYAPRQRIVPKISPGITAELTRKFNHLSRKSRHHLFGKEHSLPTVAATTSKSHYGNGHGNVVDPPVLRNLSIDFRSQLPAATMRKVYNSDVPFAKPLTNSTELLPAANPAPPPSALQLPTEAEAATASATQSQPEPTIEVEDGQYFLKLLHAEQQRLLKLAETTEQNLQELKQLKTKKPNVIALLETTVDRTRLLVGQKMLQFEGLCHNNSTNADLAAFWQTVHSEINSLDALFAQIQTMRQNNWKQPVSRCASAAGKKAQKVNTKASEKCSKSTTSQPMQSAQSLPANANSVSAKTKAVDANNPKGNTKGNAKGNAKRRKNKNKKA